MIDRNMAHIEVLTLVSFLFGNPELQKLPKVAFLQSKSIQAHKQRQFLHVEPPRLQTGWHCVHQVSLGLNKGSSCRLPTGYPTQWNPELQVSLWRASCGERSFCDAFPPFPSLASPSVHGVQCNRPEVLTSIFIGHRVCMCISSLTYSEDKVIVRLVVDSIQDIKHLDGKIWHGA